MEREIDMKEVSDGRLYGPRDMVKADCGGCAGCSQCCESMGSTIILDPFDVWRLTTGLGVSFEALLEDKLELNLVEGDHFAEYEDFGRAGALRLSERGGALQHPWAAAGLLPNLSAGKAL